MSPIENKSDEELLKSLLAESAKMSNELSCALADIIKCQNRLKFNILLINTLIQRDQINQNNFVD